jgi:hypothetical protein
MEQQHLAAWRLYRANPTLTRHHLHRVISYGKAWLAEAERKARRDRVLRGRVETRFYLMAYAYDALGRGEVRKAQAVMMQFWAA